MANDNRTFMVLLALDGDPMYGYAIRKRVLELSDGSVELEPGGLYRLMAALERDALIARADPPPGVHVTDSRRRYYALTEEGRRTLAREAQRLHELVARSEVRRVLRRA